MHALSCRERTLDDLGLIAADLGVPSQRSAMSRLVTLVAIATLHGRVRPVLKVGVVSFLTDECQLRTDGGGGLTVLAP